MCGREFFEPCIPGGVKGGYWIPAPPKLRGNDEWYPLTLEKTQIYNGETI